MPELLGPFFGGHSLALYLLVGGAALIVGLTSWLHARRYWEGLPPLLDALFSAIAFLALIGAFVLGGQWGAQWGHPHAGRVAAVAAVVIGLRAIRAWLGKEQARYRGDGR